MKQKFQRILTAGRQHAKAAMTAFGHFYRTGAPLALYGCYLKTMVARFAMKCSAGATLAQFKQETAALKLSNDWFSYNIPSWLIIFKKFGLENREIRILEIGSWEGLSAFFTLHHLPQAQLTCVDTWDGSDEHQGKDVVNQIEANFDANLARYADRLTKYKGTSFSYFLAHEKAAPFDFIYVDGSHFCDDVLIDGLKAFALLKPGGILVFDDYFWSYYKRANDNVAAAVNAFLRLKKGQYDLVEVYSQLAVRKR